MAAYFYWLLFSFEGRINRATFISAFFVLLAANLTMQFVIVMLPNVDAHNTASRIQAIVQEQGVASAALLALSALLCWALTAIHVKRLHDFGWSGWWLAAPSAAMAICAVLSAPFFLLNHVIVGAIVLAVAAALSGLGGLYVAGMAFLHRGAEEEHSLLRVSGVGAPRRRNLAPAAARVESSAFRAARQPGQGFGRRCARA